MSTEVKLSARLAKLAEYVLPSKPFADIGTDHGLLPCFLLSNNICPRGIASDKSVGPLQSAAQNAKLYEVGNKLELRRGDGLDILEPGEVSTIIIAGMGGDLINQILDRGIRKVLDETERFIIQPNVAAYRLRLWARENSWKIKEEELVKEGKIYYEIIILEGRENERLRDEDMYLGPRLLEKKHSLLVPYWRERFKSESKVIDQMLREKKPELAQKAEQIIKKQERLKREIECRLAVKM